MNVKALRLHKMVLCAVTIGGRKMDRYSSEVCLQVATHVIIYLNKYSPRVQNCVYPITILEVYNKGKSLTLTMTIRSSDREAWLPLLSKESDLKVEGAGAGGVELSPSSDSLSERLGAKDNLFFYNKHINKKEF